METVTFNCGGEKLTINPLYVTAVRPCETSPNKTMLTVFSQTYKIRGQPSLIKAALGWEDGPVIGFDTDESRNWEAAVLRAGHSEPVPTDGAEQGRKHGHESDGKDDGKRPSPEEVMGAPVTVAVEGPLDLSSV